MSLDNIVIKKFRIKFEQNCFKLLFEAYQTSLVEKQYSLDWIENDFSELLIHYISISPFSIKHQISCNSEHKNFIVNGDLEKGYSDKLSRIDFVYSVFTKFEKVKYFMEAKNLKQNDSKLKRRYINTGIDSFITKKYENGCLVGYLLEGKLEDTINGINKLLEKDLRNSEVLKLDLNRIVNSYYESNHTSIGILKHIMLDFTVI